MQIATGMTFNAGLTPVDFPDRAEPFTGELSMVASHGGRLVRTAQPTISFGPKPVDMVFTASNSETRTLVGEVFPDLPIFVQ